MQLFSAAKGKKVLHPLRVTKRAQVRADTAMLRFADELQEATTIAEIVVALAEIARRMGLELFSVYEEKKGHKGFKLRHEPFVIAWRGVVPKRLRGVEVMGFVVHCARRPSWHVGFVLGRGSVGGLSQSITTTAAYMAHHRYGEIDTFRSPRPPEARPARES